MTPISQMKFAEIHIKLSFLSCCRSAIWGI